MSASISKRPASLASFGAGLRKAREGLGWTLETLAKKTGISKPYLSNIETGSAPGPASEEKLRKLARVLGLEGREVLAAADWLRAPESVRRLVVGETGRRGEEEKRRGGEGEQVPRRADGAIDLDRLMHHGEKDERRKTKDESGAKGDGSGGEGADSNANIGRMPMPLGGPLGMALRNVPVINKVAAGKAGEFGDLSYPVDVADSYVGVPDVPEAPAGARGGAFAVRVTGDSMMPEYREGDLVIVGTAGAGGEARDGDDCVVRLGELENFATTFKRVFFERDGKGEAVGVRLVPLNPAHAERRVGVAEVTGIYPLIYRLVPRRAAAKGVKASEKLLWE